MVPNCSDKNIKNIQSTIIHVQYTSLYVITISSNDIRFTLYRGTVSRSDDEYDPSVMPWNVESHDSDNDNPPNDEGVPINDEVDPTDNDNLPREATPEQIDTGQVGGARETRHSTRTRRPINVPTSR